MTKGTINLYVDRELVEIAKARGFNISKILEDALRAITNVDVPEDRNIEEKDRQIVIDKINELNIMKQKFSKQLEIIDKEAKKRQKEHDRSVIKTVRFG